jgi:hypothetical protein
MPHNISEARPVPTTTNAWPPEPSDLQDKMPLLRDLMESAAGTLAMPLAIRMDRMVHAAQSADIVGRLRSIA